MMVTVKYRCRWLDGAGFAVVERCDERKAFGFWPVYVWHAVARFPTTKEGFEWIIDQNEAPIG